MEVANDWVNPSAREENISADAPISTSLYYFLYDICHNAHKSR